jgi:hypothetical protein
LKGGGGSGEPTTREVVQGTRTGLAGPVPLPAGGAAAKEASRATTPPGPPAPTRRRTDDDFPVKVTACFTPKEAAGPMGEQPHAGEAGQGLAVVLAEPAGPITTYLTLFGAVSLRGALPSGRDRAGITGSTTCDGLPERTPQANRAARSGCGEGVPGARRRPEDARPMRQGAGS